MKHSVGCVVEVTPWSFAKVLLFASGSGVEAADEYFRPSLCQCTVWRSINTFTKVQHLFTDSTVPRSSLEQNLATRGIRKPLWLHLLAWVAKSVKECSIAA